MNVTEKHFLNALTKLENGTPLNELYQELYKLEKEENYAACAGILKAIKKFSK
jgi:7,8-dihydro-6-hydroxymethylpterin-pyrophosphokinase